MKKRILLLVLIIALCLGITAVITGCGEGGFTSNIGNNGEKPGQTETDGNDSQHNSSGDEGGGVGKDSSTSAASALTPETTLPAQTSAEPVAPASPSASAPQSSPQPSTSDQLPTTQQLPTLFVAALEKYYISIAEGDDDAFFNVTFPFIVDNDFLNHNKELLHQMFQELREEYGQCTISFEIMDSTHWSDSELDLRSDALNESFESMGVEVLNNVIQFSDGYWVNLYVTVDGTIKRFSFDMELPVCVTADGLYCVPSQLVGVEIDNTAAVQP